MPLTEEFSAEGLAAHVVKLAGEIGERNVFNPRALHAAADYLTAEWRVQDYQLIPHTYRGLSHLLRFSAGANCHLSRGSRRRLERPLFIPAPALARFLMMTDTAFYRYPYYHTAADTPEKLDYASLARVTRGLFQAFVALAGCDPAYAI